MADSLAESVEGLVSNLENARETKTIFFADLYGSTEYKVNHADLDWVPVLGQFYKLATTAIQAYKGQVIKFIGDAVMAAFDDAGAALQAAISIQENIEEERRHHNRGLPCKIGIATGSVYRYQTADGKYDYLGTNVDMAARLAEEARGFAILLSSKTYQAADTTRVTSKAGVALGREAEEYFGEKIAHDKLKGIKDTVYFYSLFWQGSKAYVDDKPAEQSPTKPATNHPVPPQSPIRPNQIESGKRYSGMVDRITPNYGWINLTLADGHVESIWFHKERTVGKNMPSEGDKVHFLVYEKEDGRKQAYSIFRLGNELRGRISRYTPRDDKFGFLVAKDEDANDVSIFFLPYDLAEEVKVGDEVKFELYENPRGLKAVKIRPWNTQGSVEGKPSE